MLASGRLTQSLPNRGGRMCCQTCMRGTLQQSSMQQQLQQHPSWEAAVGSRAPDLGPDHQLQQWRSVGGSAILSGAFIFFLVDTG